MDRPITDPESLSEEPISFDPEDEQWTLFDEPCPFCGGTEFYERREEFFVVKCNEDGTPDEFIPDGMGDTITVWCRECDEVVFD
jgi:hypothetical protein